MKIFEKFLLISIFVAKTDEKDKIEIVVTVIAPVVSILLLLLFKLINYLKLNIKNLWYFIFKNSKKEFLKQILCRILTSFKRSAIGYVDNKAWQKRPIFKNFPNFH